MSDTYPPAHAPHPSAPDPSAPNPFAPGTDEHAIWAGALAIYAGFTASDRAAIDANISPEATMFDSDTMPLIHGRAELDVIRDARPAPDADAASTVPTTTPVLRGIAPEVRIWGDIALLLHYLAVDLGDGSPEQTVRNTSVWRRASRADQPADPRAGDPADSPADSPVDQPADSPRWLMVHNHEDVMATHWLPESS